jgi:hypothetical protein
MSFSLMPPIRTAARWGVALLLCAGLAACGASDDTSHTSSEPTVQSAASGGFVETGTITATLDGKRHAWTTYRPPGDRPGTARWTMRLSVGWTGTDIEEGSAGLLGYSGGFNQGEQFEINFPFEVGQAQTTFDLAGEAADVHYRPSGYRGPKYSMTDGVLNVTRIAARKDGASQFEGTFRGTLTAQGEGTTRTVTDGAFTIEEGGFEE